MNKYLSFLVGAIVFCIGLLISFIFLNYILFSIPPMNKIVIPNAGAAIVVILSGILSVCFSYFFSKKFYKYMLSR